MKELEQITASRRGFLRLATGGAALALGAGQAAWAPPIRSNARIHILGAVAGTL